MTRLIGVDVGGTFTDVVISDEATVTGFKVPTTPNQATGVAAAVDWRADDQFLHGTTAATNTLLEERGARLGLVTDVGFEDLVEIGRQDRPSLYDPDVDRPRPLVERGLRVGRDDEELTSRLADAEIVVVGLIEGYLRPEEEVALTTDLRRRLGRPVLAATTITPEFREYERLATALLSAYLTPSVAGYLGSLEVPVSRRLVMTSAGGLLPFDQGAMNAARLVLSGPAGGVVAAAALGASHGHDTVISFDMGGTSTDVCRIDRGRPLVGTGHRVAGRENRVPSVPVRTIGAGGGSMGWIDPGGALRVGPQSAGAVPGPACYGSGGTAATVTDANLMLGHIPLDLDLAGSLPLDGGLAEKALARLGERLDMSPRAVAEGMLRVVDSHMEHAIRAVTVEQGVDPRETALVAFGGAGGLHAPRLAAALAIPRVLVPPFSGVFSAIGLLMAAPRADAARTMIMAEGDRSLGARATEVETTATQRYLELFGRGPAVVEGGLDCRYAGQSHEVEIEGATDWAAVRAGFEEAHHRLFGFVRPGEPIEVVNVRAVASGDPPLTWAEVSARSPAPGPPLETGGVWRRDTFPPGHEVEGPAVIIEETSAVLLGAGDHLLVLDDGTLEITRG
ncbi:MAG: hydantoinase/oxoprolinase family protein [Actinobacteria bacterium]|nr:hydantoinase/oxoprolinase family protein [Actinomycetota bacterium]